jgi:hypothetical protein
MQSVVKITVGCCWFMLTPTTNFTKILSYVPPISLNCFTGSDYIFETFVFVNDTVIVLDTSLSWVYLVWVMFQKSTVAVKWLFLYRMSILPCSWAWWLMAALLHRKLPFTRNFEPVFHQFSTTWFHITVSKCSICLTNAGFLCNESSVTAAVLMIKS